MAPTTPKKVDTDTITDEDREPGVVYIGHVPHGFYEEQLFKYFSQFGKVQKVKLCRSNKNGKSKGYAFVKFRYGAVAKLVAETCHNYLFFNKLLKCEYKRMDEIHKDTFLFYKWTANKRAKRQHNGDKSANKQAVLTSKAVKKQSAKLKKLQEFGINLELGDVLDTTELNLTACTTAVAPVKNKKTTKAPKHSSKLKSSARLKISSKVGRTSERFKPKKDRKTSVTPKQHKGTTTLAQKQPAKASKPAPEVTSGPAVKAKAAHLKQPVAPRRPLKRSRANNSEVITKVSSRSKRPQRKLKSQKLKT